MNESFDADTMYRLVLSIVLWDELRSGAWYA